MTDPVATTDQGTGPMLAIGKTIGHLMVVFTGHTRNNTDASVWNMTGAEAALEIGDALSHAAIVFPPHIMTNDTMTAIADWVHRLNRLAQTYAAMAPTTPINTVPATQVRDLLTRSWTLLTRLDRELLGTPIGTSEPGRLP